MAWHGMGNGVLVMVLSMLMVPILTDSPGWMQLAHIPFNIQILKAQEGIKQKTVHLVKVTMLFLSLRASQQSFP
jgi:hypothetical protein